MTLITTKINLSSPLFSNTAANSCLTYAREIFGGREVTVVNPSSISIKIIDPVAQALYTTALKVIACLILVPLGLIFRLISLRNELVSSAFSYTPPPAPPPPAESKKPASLPINSVLSSTLIEHIQQKKYNLLPQYVGHEIQIEDDSHLIQIIKSYIYGRCPALLSSFSQSHGI